MMYKRFYFLLAMLWPGLSIAQNSLGNNQTLVFGTYQDGNNSRIQNIGPFANHFGEVAEIKTVVKSYPSLSLLLQAMNDSEVDVAFLNTFGYLMHLAQSSTFEISAALHLPDIAATSNKSVIVTPRQEFCISLEDGISQAPDNILILVSPSSTTGNIIPRLKFASLMKEDPEMLFLEVQYVSQNLALQNMLTERFAIAAVGKDTYEKLGADTVKVRKLWESPEIPMGPVVCKKNLPENLKISLKTALLELHEQNPAALESLKLGWAEAKSAVRFNIVEDARYENIIKLAGSRERAMRIIWKYAK